MRNYLPNVLYYILDIPHREVDTSSLSMDTMELVSSISTGGGEVILTPISPCP